MNSFQPFVKLMTESQYLLLLISFYEKTDSFVLEKP